MPGRLEQEHFVGQETLELNMEVTKWHWRRVENSCALRRSKLSSTVDELGYRSKDRVDNDNHNDKHDDAKHDRDAKQDNDGEHDGDNHGA